MTDIDKITKTLIDNKFDNLVEKKGKFSYAPWATAVKQLLKLVPSATWSFEPTTQHGDYVMVKTTVTIYGVTRPCILPCYAIPKGGGQPRSIPNPDTYDLNTAYMRCLVKNIAMFGLGIDIYTQDETDEFYIEFDENGEKLKNVDSNIKKATEIAQENQNMKKVINTSNTQDAWVRKY